MNMSTIMGACAKQLARRAKALFHGIKVQVT